MMLRDDGVHLTPTGAAAMGHTIARAVAPALHAGPAGKGSGGVALAAVALLAIGGILLGRR